MATFMRKMIIIVFTTILLQPIIKGNRIYFDDDDNNNENIDVSNLDDFNFNSEETNSILDFDSNEFENIDDDRLSKKSLTSKNTHYCVAIPTKEHYLNTEEFVYKPSVIQEYDCKQLHHHIRTYQPHIHGGICYIPGEHCKPEIIRKNLFRREKNSHWWYPYKHTMNISLGCKCHNLNTGL